MCTDIDPTREKNSFRSSSSSLPQTQPNGEGLNEEERAYQFGDMFFLDNMRIPVKEEEENQTLRSMNQPVCLQTKSWGAPISVSI